MVITTLIVSLSFLPVLAQENDPNKYLLIIYYEGDRTNTGDLVTLKAELFLEGKRLRDPNNVRIEGSIQIPPPNFMQFTLEYEGKGIFTYVLTIPNINEVYDLPIHFNAYIGDENVAYNWITIPIENNLSTGMNIIRIFHTFSHQVIKPNDTIRITSYIPEVENGTIDSTEVNITTEVWIKYPHREVNETASQFSSDYLDNGYFRGLYTIPMVIANRSLRVTSALNVVFEIRAKIQNEEFEYWHQIPINDFNIFSSLKFEDDNLNLKLVALNEDLEPMKDVEWFVINSYVRPAQILSLPSFIPATNEEGITEITLHPIEFVNYLGLVIIGVKNNSVALEEIMVSNSSSIFYIESDYLSIIPTIYNFEHGLHYFDEGIRGSFFALFNGELLQNKEITLFLYWSKGIISVYKTKTNNEGSFFIKQSLPNGYGDSPWYQCFLHAAYNNGTTWISTSYPATLFETYFLFQFNHSINAVNIPSIEIEEYEQYDRVNLTWEVPSDSSIYSLNFFPQYNSVPTSVYNSIPRSFTGNTPFMNHYSSGIMVKNNENRVNYVGCMDKDPNLNHIIIEGISYTKANPKDMLFHYWFINPDGSIRDKPKDFPNPPLFTLDVDLTLRIGLFLCVLGAMVLAVYGIKRTKP
jgi:hypothetical protein